MEIPKIDKTMTHCVEHNKHCKMLNSKASMNTDGPFTVTDSSSFLSPYDILTHHENTPI